MGTNVFKRIWHFVRDIEVILSLCGSLAALPLVGGVTAVLLNLEMPAWVIVVAIAITCSVLGGFLIGLVGVIQKRRHEKRMLQLLAATVQYLEMRQDEAQERNSEAFQSILKFNDHMLVVIQSMVENDKKFFFEQLASIERRKADKPRQTPLDHWLS